MSVLEEMKNHTLIDRKKSVPGLIINLLLPWILFSLLRYIFANDAILLAITGSIPAVRTLAQWIGKRKIDYMGVISVICFVIALVISALTGGNPLPLKLIHPMAFGTIGIVCIISVIMDKPLLIILFSVISGGSKERLNSAISRKKLTVMTLLLGGILFASSTIHIILALTLPTGTFIAINSLVTWGTIAALIGCAKLIMPRIK